jgi:catechol 2,3-dioxygenase-like lactoylglutathione lyase family enzyme
MRLEVVVVPVTDVGRATRFYRGLGWRVDADVSSGDDCRLMQLPPPASSASIILGKGVTSDEPGSIDSLVLAVDDIDAASEVFHDAGGGLGAGWLLREITERLPGRV